MDFDKDQFIIIGLGLMLDAERRGVRSNKVGVPKVGGYSE